MPKTKLKRELGLFSTTLYGIGVIIGAGIYALLGVGAGIAGNMVWLAFLVSALIAIFTGFSYAELSSMFPKEAAEYNYTRKAFGKETFSFLVGWVLAIGVVIAASTVALGFGGYFSSVFGGEPKIIAAGLLVVMTLLSYVGIKESATFNNFASILEVLGLLVVVAIALLSPPVSSLDLFQMPAAGFAGIMAAASVVFFAYTGFESIANLAEEVKEGSRIVPKALVFSLVISTLLYIAVSIAAVREVGWETLAGSKAPLTTVVSRSFGQYAPLFSFIAMFSTANTALIFLITASRILYGMSEKKSLLPVFSSIGLRGTPYFSVFIVGGVAFLSVVLWDIKTVAQLADLSVFIGYTAVNLSLIMLAFSQQNTKRTFTSPRFFGFPVLALLGALSSFFMLLAFEWHLWIMEIVLVAVGVLIYIATKRRSNFF